MNWNKSRSSKNLVWRRLWRLAVAYICSASGCECLFAEMKLKTSDNSYAEGDFFFLKKKSHIKWLSYGTRITASIDSVSELAGKAGSLFKALDWCCFYCCSFCFDLRMKCAVQLAWQYSVITAIMSEINEDVDKKVNSKQDASAVVNPALSLWA